MGKYAGHFINKLRRSNFLKFGLISIHIGLLYKPRFNRLGYYRLFFFLLVCIPIMKLFRPRLAIIQYAKRLKQNKEVQAQQVKELLVDVELNAEEIEQDYIVVLYAPPRKNSMEGEIDFYQKTLFQLNEEIRRKEQMIEGSLQDVKFLFIGKEQVYEILGDDPVTKRIDFYQKDSIKVENTMGERASQECPVIAIMSKDEDGISLLNCLEMKSDLGSILRMINKDKVQKFAKKFKVSE